MANGLGKPGPSFYLLMTQSTRTDLQRAEAAYLAANWNKMPRSERRNFVRLWWRTRARFGDSFGNSWRTITSSIKNPAQAPQ
jgi:hypothetical protein